MEKKAYIYIHYDEPDDVTPVVRLIYISDSIEKAVDSIKETLDDMFYEELAEELKDSMLEVIDLNEFEGFIVEDCNPV